jgi:hypothetical protein
MPSAKVYRFPKSSRRRVDPARSRAPAFVVVYPYSRCTGGFGGLMLVTLLAAWFYLSEAAGMARHDVLYGALLTSVWSVFFAFGALLRMRVVGTLLACGALGGLAAFFGVGYWLILTHP